MLVQRFGDSSGSGCLAVGSASADGSNITLAPDGDAPPGPFKITPVYCGQYTKAQVNQYVDDHGLIFRYANMSSSLTGYPVLSVSFASGSEVTGSNVNGSEPAIAPGQSALADVGAAGASGQSLKFTGCELTSYTLTGDTSSCAP